MTADDVIAAWVPWSAGEAGRYSTKLAAAAELRRRLDEAGFVIVPRVATEAMIKHSGNTPMTGVLACLSEQVWNAMIRQSQR